jgi:hypothetical protein
MEARTFHTDLSPYTQLSMLVREIELLISRDDMDGACESISTYMAILATVPNAHYRRCLQKWIKHYPLPIPAEVHSAVPVVYMTPGPVYLYVEEQLACLWPR